MKKLNELGSGDYTSGLFFSCAPQCFITCREKHPRRETGYTDSLSPSKRSFVWRETQGSAMAVHQPHPSPCSWESSPTTVGTTRDHPPPWALRGIAHHRAYYAASPTTVDTRPHREPRSAKVPHFHAPTRPASRNSLETAPLAHTRPERSVVHARSIRETSKKQKKTVGLHAHRS